MWQILHKILALLSLLRLGFEMWVVGEGRANLFHLGLSSGVLINLTTHSSREEEGRLICGHYVSLLKIIYCFLW